MYAASTTASDVTCMSYNAYREVHTLAAKPLSTHDYNGRTTPGRMVVFKSGKDVPNALSQRLETHVHAHTEWWFLVVTQVDMKQQTEQRNCEKFPIPFCFLLPRTLATGKTKYYWRTSKYCGIAIYFGLSRMMLLRTCGLASYSSYQVLVPGVFHPSGVEFQRTDRVMLHMIVVVLIGGNRPWVL